MTLRCPATWTFAACLLLAVVTGVPALVAPTAGYGLRLPLSLAFALFVPGYLLLCAVFPGEAALGHLARLALSLACSFPLIIVVTIMLHVTPFDRSADAQILATAGLVLLLAIAATWRQRGLPATARLTYVLASDDSGFWRDPFAGLALGLVVLLAGASITGLAGATHDQATSFSLPVGDSQVNPIQANHVTVHVHSHERSARSFQVVVAWQGQVIGRSAPFTLQPDQSLDTQISTTPPPGRGPVPVDVMLFEQGGAVPYRQLHVWMRTIPYRIVPDTESR